MNFVRLIAPAKVNLLLAVGPKQPDGLHKVDTIMHTLALHDTLAMRRFPEDEGGLAVTLSCEATEGVVLDVDPEENLAVRAVRALARKLGRAESEQIQIALTKAIPTQAGLGGGSSDAAAALLGAAVLWDVPEDDPRIEEVARELGADVPFFLHGGCLRLDGRGDHACNALEPSKRFCVLVRPDAGVPTKEAYQRFDEDPCCFDQAFLDGLSALRSAHEVPIGNNLMPAAKAIVPELAQIEAWAEGAGVAASGAEPVVLTASGVSGVSGAPGAEQGHAAGCQGVLCGSGSAYAVLCGSYEQAVALSVSARKEGWSTRVTALSPLGATVVERF